MDPGTLALLIPIVAILAGAYQRVTKIKADTAASLKDATGHLDGSRGAGGGRAGGGGGCVQRRGRRLDRDDRRRSISPLVAAARQL